MLTMVDKVVFYMATSASMSVVADVERNADALTSRLILPIRYLLAVDDCIPW